MSHRNTPKKTKVALAKRSKTAAKLERVASGSTRGGTKQETVLGLLKQPKGTTIAAIESDRLTATLSARFLCRGGA